MPNRQAISWSNAHLHTYASPGWNWLKNYAIRDCSRCSNALEHTFYKLFMMSWPDWIIRIKIQTNLILKIIQLFPDIKMIQDFNQKLHICPKWVLMKLLYMFHWVSTVLELFRFSMLEYINPQRHTYKHVHLKQICVVLSICSESTALLIQYALTFLISVVLFIPRAICGSLRFIYPYCLGLLRNHWGNRMSAPLSLRQPWRDCIKSLNLKKSVKCMNNHWKVL